MTMGCSKLFVKQAPPLIECDKAETPKRDPVTYRNAPELLVELYGYVQAEHACLDEHRKRKDIR